MGLLSGILRAVVNPTTLFQLAMGPAGWASIAMRAVVSAVAQQVIQKLGQQLGLPQSIINMAQTAFSAASGGQGLPRTIPALAQQFGLSAMQQGEMERTVSDITNNLANSLSQSKEFKEAKASGGKSWLMAIAEALGKQADKLANEMQAMSDKLGSGSKESQASDNLKFGAKSQEFGQFFNSANTVIKTVGEALNAGSRKQ
jgi:hypothetical protein